MWRPLSLATAIPAATCVWLLTAAAAQAEVRDLEVVAIAGEPFGVGVITLHTGDEPPPQMEQPREPRRRGILRRGRIFGRGGVLGPDGVLGEDGPLGPNGPLGGLLGEGGIVVDLGTGDNEETPVIYLDEEHGRVLYPAQARGTGRGVRGLIRGVLSGTDEAPRGTTAYFLFRGDEPFDLKVYQPEKFQTRVHPRRDASLHRDLLALWWASYRSEGRQSLLGSGPEYPREVENFLQLTLARRLNLPAPRQQRLGLESIARLMGEPEIGTAYAPLLGTDSLKAALQREVLLSDGAGEVADRPLPLLDAAPAVDWTAVPVETLPAANGDPAADDVPAENAPAAAADNVIEEVVIEEMANYVPEECFYLRFGNFDNFWWLKTLIDRAEGDLGTLFLTESVRYEISERMQDRLEIRDVLLADVLGPLVIADAAIVGNDMFLREGASIAFLLRAHNTIILGSFIRNHRKTAVKKYPDAVLEDVQIAGKTVSYLHTPDNRVRSFYAVIGDYHFVTTSRALMERFFEASSGKRSLGQSDEFRVARRRMPISRHDTMFAYLSDAFFENLATPHYRIEMVRRLKAQVRLEAAMLARLAARAEGVPHETVEDLIAAGLLPRDFNQTPDGSRISFVDGKPVCSLRGGLGSLIPVTDVQIDRVTAREEAQYREFAISYRQDWGRMPPLQVGLRREVEDGGAKDRVRIDLAAMPITRTPPLMQWMQMLTGGGPVEVRVPADGLLPEIVIGAADATPGVPRESRIQFERLEDSPLALLLNPMAERSAERNLRGSLHFLNAMHQQLRVPAKDCLTVANQVLNGELVSTIGGKFVLDETSDYPVWTHRADGSRAGQHAFRPLNWCRSLDARWQYDERKLTAQIDTLLELPPAKVKSL